MIAANIATATKDPHTDPITTPTLTKIDKILHGCHYYKPMSLQQGNVNLRVLHQKMKLISLIYLKE
jgi:hypothetical protein